MKIYNKPEQTEEFIVARDVEGEKWYWGSWDDRDRANEVAIQIGGEVWEKGETE